MTRIRNGGADDCAAIHRVEISAGALFAGTHMAWAVGDTTSPEDLREGAEAGLLWVAEDGVEIVGFLLAEELGCDLHLWEVAVHADRHGQGIGRALVEAALAEGARRGLTAATLTTDRTLPWNAPWYARLAFETLRPEETPERLADQLASEPNPHRRCAMRRAL